MGMYSVLCIYHDHAHEITEDPEGFWAAAWHALNQCGSQPQKFGLGGSYPVGVALHVDHVDSARLMLLAASGAETLVVANRPSMLPWTPEAQLEMLKKAADKLGYRVQKKPKRRKKTDG